MTLTLVYDGGCPFCSQFALRSELLGGVVGLRILDGREDHALRRALAAKGMNLANGAVLLDGDDAWHGSAAITELCRRMNPSDALLRALVALFCRPERAAFLYPCLLLARRLLLAFKGLPNDPETFDAKPGQKSGGYGP